jgi:hypothetical protein
MQAADRLAELETQREETPQPAFAAPRRAGQGGGAQLHQSSIRNAIRPAEGEKPKRLNPHEPGS